jgi:integrase
MLKEIREKQGLTSKYVFTYHARVTQRFGRAFKDALRSTGTEDFRFHDLRHTFASHLVMRGASLEEV